MSVYAQLHSVNGICMDERDQGKQSPFRQPTNFGDFGAQLSGKTSKL